MKSILLLSATILVMLVSCTNEKLEFDQELEAQLRAEVNAVSPTGTLAYYIFPSEYDLKKIPQDPKNPITPIKVELGKMLYFETGLGLEAKKPEAMGTFSCATCHVPEVGFKPNNFQGVADGGLGFGVHGELRTKRASYDDSELDVQSARPLTMVNVAYVQNTMWNGSMGGGNVNIGTEAQWNNNEATARNYLGMSGMETQNIDGLKTHRIVITKESLDKFGYTYLFDAAFSDVPKSERYNRTTASLALSAYLRTILATQAPFQNWLKGDETALSVEEKQGAMLFFGKAKCATCHYEANLGSHEFHALGVKDMYQRESSFFKRPDDLRNLGRGGFTGNDADYFKFRVPGIYNIDGTKFYFHGASKTSLLDVVEYKLNAVSENPNVPQSRISKKLQKISLSDEEKNQLVTFLEKSIHDPNLGRYRPNSVLSKQCFPNNDIVSKKDMDCD